MKYVGKSYPIHDAIGKATGHIRYVGDMEFQGMLHAAVIFSEIPHGIVKKIDYTEALKLEGVIDYVDCFNTTDKKYNRYHTQYRQDLVHNETVFNSHVRYIGDRIGAIIATTEEIARKAVALVKVEYEELPFSLTMEETLSGKIDNVYEEGAIYGVYHHEVGEKPTAEDLVEIKTTTDLSRINHMCMETHACIAEYDRYTKKLTIYSPNQTVYGIRSVIADIFEMDYNNVRVVKTTMGGSFGGKQEWVLEPVAAAAALKVGAPVRLSYNRSETVISTYGRAPMHFESTFKFTKDGKLQSLDCDMTLDAGAYVGNSVNYARTVAHKLFRAYKYPHMNYNTRAVITNTIVNGAFRGWTGPEACIMVEHNMNMAARKLNIDPVDLRIMNSMRENDIDPMSGISMGNYKGVQSLERGRELFKWDELKKEVEEFNKTNVRYKRGIGVGYGGHVNNFYPGKTDFGRVDMRLSESGSVQCNMTLHDHGCGTVMVMKMIVAETLDIHPDLVHIGEGDTNSTPLDVGCFSSRTTFVLGRTAYECAVEFKKRMAKHVSMFTGISEDDLVVGNQMVYSKSDESVKYTWSDVFDFSQQKLKAEVFVSTEHIPDTNPGVCGAHFAYVQVDTYTGMVKILDYLAVHDIGQAINREICIAQTQGAVIMGSGAALTEHVLIRKNGVPSGNLKDYHLINAFEAPDVKVEFIEEGGTEGPYGAKTIGEICHIPVTATVVGAVNDALKSDMNCIPLTPDVITNYLRNREVK